MRLEFWAIDPNGEDVRGIREVSSREELIQILIRRRLLPMDIKEASPAQEEIERLKELRNGLLKKEPQSRIEINLNQTDITPKNYKTGIGLVLLAALTGLGIWLSMMLITSS